MHRPVLPVLATGAVLILTLAGCAAHSATPAAGPPSPERVRALEARVEQDPSDLGASLELASARLAAGMPDEVAPLLEPFLPDPPTDADPALLAVLGFAAEAEEDWESARTRYAQALEAGARGELAEEVDRRAELVRLEGLRAAARAAVAREAELADVAPAPGRVGVFPFVVRATDPSFAPLGRAFAELLTTDLGLSGRLTLVERIQVQALVDEVALGEAGLVEEASAVRGGRLLGAGRVVQGAIEVDGDALRVDAALVRVGEDVPSVPVGADGDVEALFDLEKEIVLGLFDEMGVDLTPAERAAITERRTDNLRSLLAFGEGLVAFDAGDYDAAAVAFSRATTFDPNFELARSRSSEASSAAAAAEVEAVTVGQRTSTTARQRQAVQRIRNLPAARRAAAAARVRAVLAEVTGSDRILPFGIELVFVRPGG